MKTVLTIILATVMGLTLASCGDSEPPSQGAGISAGDCEPWMRWRAGKSGQGDAQAAQAKAPAICACVSTALNKSGVLTPADAKALKTYFTVFSNPVKRDPTYGHISQAGRRSLDLISRQCAKKQGLDLK